MCRKFTDIEVSPLGFGCMRFPKTEDQKIDRPEAKRMLLRAYEGGINYYDTAYPYHDGESEEVLGEFLAENDLRDKVNIATKCPVWEIKKEGDFERIFSDQLKKLRTDHIDFYLLHALDRQRVDDIVLKFGLIDKVRALKEQGVIGHMGFSFHDSLDSFCRIVDMCPDWDFCQIQMNYINTDYQAGLAGLRYAHSKGLSVIIMEPLLGGRLASPPERVMDALPKGKSAPELGFDFLWNMPEVGLVLSGMSTMQQVEDNLGYMTRSHIGMLSAEEIKCYETAKEIFDKMALVPCTKCAYCMPCPVGIDIPAVYEAYNATVSRGMDKARQMYKAIPTTAEACVGCGKCLAVCPQHIDSPQLMRKIAEVFAE